MKPTDLPPKLTAKIRVDEETGCWIWTGYVRPNGYGVMHWPPKRRARQWLAHRLSYELLVGPIPEGRDLDHRCHTADQSCPGGPFCLHRRCVNPMHLQPVTQAENSHRQRGIGKPNLNGYCRNGHPWIAANIYIRPSGERGCNICMQQQRARWRSAGKHRKGRPGPGQGSLL